MSEEYCRLVGYSACLCGKGEILVEFCASKSRSERHANGIYRNTMTCSECSEKYFFFQPRSNETARLASKDEFATIQATTRNINRILEEIARSSAFKSLCRRLNGRLDTLPNSARYGLLSGNGLAYGSIDRCKTRPYKLPAFLAGRAKDFLGFHDAHLDDLIEKLNELDRLPSYEPNPYTTGNIGLDA